MAGETGQAAPTFRISTDDLPQRDRLVAMREYVGRSVLRLEIEPGCLDRPLHYSAVARSVPGAIWGTARTSPVASGRTRSLLADGCDDIMLGVTSSGMTIEEAGKPDLDVPPGTALVTSQAKIHRVVYHSETSAWVLCLPRSTIAGMVPGIGEAPTFTISPHTPALSLLMGYAKLLENDPLVGAALQQTASRHLQDMAALVLGASPDFQQFVNSGTVRTARMRSIKAFIQANLGNTALSLVSVAAKSGVTPRYIQMLFEQEGTSFTEFLRRSRTGEALRLLRDPRTIDRTILSIALECGFSEASALNRAFREEYRMTPGDARVRADRP